MRDHAVNMEAGKIFVFSMLIAQAISAPTNCIELCAGTGQQSMSSYQSSGSYSSHSDIVQGTNSRGSNLLSFDNRRPNWSEHNEYVTDGGRGKVYEEKGQYLDGQKHVSYFKKNYSSSYSTGNVGGLEDLSRLAQVSQIPVGIQTVNQEHEYDRERHRQQIQLQPVGHAISQGQRHEQLGQYHASHSSQSESTESRHQVAHDRDRQVTVNPDENWRTVDSYKTDGGHGRVYEERGQYVSGPSKVRYYKKNYTASYGTAGNPVVLTDDLQRHVQDIHREFEGLTRNTERLTNVHDVSTTGIREHQLVETGMNGHVIPAVERVSPIPSSRVVNQEHVSENRYEKTSSRNVYVPSETIDTTSHRDTINQHAVHGHYTLQPQISPSQTVYGKEDHTRYEGQYSYGVRQPVYVPSGSTQDAVITSESLLDEESHRRRSNVQQTSATDLTSSRRVGHDDYGRQTVVYPGTSSGHVTQYEERWSSSNRPKGTLYPQPERLQTGQHVLVGHDGSQRHESHQHSSMHSSYEQSSHSSQSSGHNSEYRRIPSGQLVSGTVDLGQMGHSVDCTDETAEHMHHDSHRYHRMYKRNVKTGRHGGPWMYNSHHSRRYQTTTPEPQVEEQTEKQQFPNQQLNFQREMTGNRENSQSHATEFHGFSQQTSGNLEFGQQGQKLNKLDEVPRANQYAEDFGQRNEDLQQHTGGFDDFLHQTSGHLEFGQLSQEPQHPGQVQVGNQHLEDLGQHNEDLQQHTGGFDDFTQQTSGNLEFGQQSQKPHQSGPVHHRYPHAHEFGQHSEDLQQHTGGFGDFTQQTSGNLEFGQQSQKPRHPGQLQVGNQHVGQHNEDLQQHTGGFEDFTQQTSGKLEFGQQSQKPQHPGQIQVGNQHVGQQNEDLQQHTGGFEDFTQQTSGKLEFGQQSQKPQHPGQIQVGNQHVEDFGQHNEDLQQHTGGFEDFTQQTSGKLEFGQQSQKPQHPGQIQVGNQHVEDFGQHNEDLQQHTGGFEDFTQQTSGKLEFGQQSQKPRKPGQIEVGNQHAEDFGQQNEDLQQHTGGFEDFTQQTSGKLEFGQQSQKPRKPGQIEVANQHAEDFGQQNEDLQQHTGGFEDFTQQTSGKLEFGQQSQKPRKPGQIEVGNQHAENFGQENEDLQQHTGGFEDFTQQTSGKLEFGLQHQKPRKPGQIEVGNQHAEDFGQHNEDLQQHTGGFEDFTQQTSGKLEFGQQHQKPRKPGQIEVGNQHAGNFGQHNEDLQQRTGGFEDFSQQTSGNLEFGHQHQKPRKPGQIEVGNQHAGNFGQHNEDLQQHTGGFEDFSQQTSGNLEFGHQHQKPRKPGQIPHGNEHLEDLDHHTDDLQQHSGSFDDFTQQTSGNFDFGYQQTSEKEDMQQHSGHFDDFSQQTSGDFQFGQQTQDYQKPGQAPTGQQNLDDFSQHDEDFQRPSTGHLEVGRIEKPEKPLNCQSSLCRKPAPKPTPKPRPGRGSRYGMDTLRSPATVPPQETTGGDTIHSVLVPLDANLEPVMEDNRNEKLRGDQELVTSSQKVITEDHHQHSTDNNIQQQQNVDDWGLQWHQKHKPSDLTNDYTQQHSQEPVFPSESQTHFHQDMEFSQRQQKQLEVLDLNSANHEQQVLDYSQQVNHGWEQQTDDVQIEPKPRILEAYGSSGPYDPTHDENLFNGVTVNPTATLPPHVNSEDSWIVREKPRQFSNPPVTTVMPENIPEITTTEAPPPGFWGRVSHKIQSTLDKAKEKAKEVFG